MFYAGDAAAAEIKATLPSQKVATELLQKGNKREKCEILVQLSDNMHTRRTEGSAVFSDRKDVTC